MPSGITVKDLQCTNLMVALQVLGKVPTISVEKTDGCQMFLSEDSKGVEIITAKSSEMNVSIPDGDEFVSNLIANANAMNL